MNRLSPTALTFLSFVILMALPVASFAQLQFEGVIESKNTTTDERGGVQRFTMTMYIKGERMRIHNSSIGGQPASTMIYRGDRKVVWMLNDDDSTYAEILQDQTKEEILPPSVVKNVQPVVRKSGRKKSVLGYACEQILVSDNDVETEIWATKSLGQLYAAISKVLGTENVPDGEDWENAVMKMGYYPLIASSRLEGKVVESQEITGLERKPLSDALFELPNGFTKQSVERGPRE